MIFSPGDQVRHASPMFPDLYGRVIGKSWPFILVRWEYPIGVTGPVVAHEHPTDLQCLTVRRLRKESA